MTHPGPRPSIDPAFAGELIGATVSLAHPGLAGRTVEGAIVDETMNTFLVRTRTDGRRLRIPKSGATGTILLGGRALPLSGDLLRHRPEDRTKRLAPSGRRR